MGYAADNSSADPAYSALQVHPAVCGGSEGSERAVGSDDRQGCGRSPQLRDGVLLGPDRRVTTVGILQVKNQLLELCQYS